MRLTPFITENTDAILEQFEEFARTHTEAGEAMNIVELRDHAKGMLETIVLDMSRGQSDKAQETKSKGDAPPDQGPEPTAAEQHGTDRAESGFTLPDMFAEYRALRASVLRLWTESWSRPLDEKDVQDLIRFNEAIDQSLAESITRFTREIERSREMFLAILGHDLRTPLGAVVTASSFLVSDGGLAGANLIMASRIQSSGRRMQRLISDLLDFTSARLGGGIQITRTEADLADIARAAVDELATQHPSRELRLEVSGDVRGRWDPQRVAQALTNLVANAIQHGAEDTPITVTVRGDPDEPAISVHNLGPVIPLEEQRQIFNPLVRMTASGLAAEVEGSMGLGLYIVEQIALAHGGWIGLSSASEEGTTFTLHLPSGAA
jgi:signal transduction histidine kinase